MATQVPKNLYGYGTSTLSIKNKKYGFTEELVGEKDIGLSGFLRKEGTISSALYTTRCKLHLQDFVDKCIKDNTIGTIYKISVNDELVKIVNESMNIFTNDLQYSFGSKQPSIFRFSIDSDIINKTNNVVFHNTNIMARIGFSLNKNEESKNFYIEDSIENLNNKAYKFDFSGYEADKSSNAYTFNLNTFELTLPDGYDNTRNVFVIYDILMALV